MSLDSRGAEVASIGFTLAYDPSRLSIAQPSNDVTRGAALGAGQAFSSRVSENVATNTGQVQVVITPPVSFPIPAIADGVVARICFKTAADAQPGCAAIPFVSGRVDIGDVGGSDLPIEFPADGGISISEPGLDHFACYKAKPQKAPKGAPEYPTFTPRKGDVFADRFATALPEDQEKVDLKAPKAICNPTNKNGEDPTAPGHETHLEGYLAKPTKTKPAQPKFTKRVEIFENQFGRVALELLSTDRALVPTSKVLGEEGAPPLAEDKVDHFRCYKANQAEAKRGEQPLPAFQRTVVTLEDQFGGPLRYDLRKPTRVCNPATVNGEDPAAAQSEDLLVCYSGTLDRRPPKQPKFEAKVVSTRNQFGEEVLKASAFEELCVPSRLAPAESAQ